MYSNPNSPVCGLNVSREDAARMEQRFNQMRPDPSLFRGSGQGPAEIDVYWNIIAANRTREGGWVPTDAIQQQMRVINQDLAPAGFKFRHIRTRRILNVKWFHLGVNLTNDIQDPLWNTFAPRFRTGGPETLNIYTVPLIPLGIVGVGSPPSFLELVGDLDGILLHPIILPGGPIPEYNQGKTLSHEVGHWLGLFHTFEGGCNAPGDFVSDTAPQRDPTGKCEAFQATCGVAPTINNYMDYIPDACRLEFTTGQIARMQGQTRAFRGIAV
ncbi:hypothetical protein AX16_009210 [Volvariella volvacea WC 439]|nr:hypothetical protein AX16_009210 [Volvariella volvacea WC 439]